jgi:hypothetical protein
VCQALGRLIKEVTITPSEAARAETPKVSGYCEFDVEGEEAQGITQWGPESDNPHSFAVMLAGAQIYKHFSARPDRHFEVFWSVDDAEGWLERFTDGQSAS